jgi:hypothetical protein
MATPVPNQVIATLFIPFPHFTCTQVLSELHSLQPACSNERGASLSKHYVSSWSNASRCAWLVLSFLSTVSIEHCLSYLPTWTAAWAFGSEWVLSSVRSLLPRHGVQDTELPHW